MTETVGIVVGALLGVLFAVLFTDRVASVLARFLGPLAPTRPNTSVKGTWLAYYDVVHDGEQPPHEGDQINPNRVETVEFHEIGNVVVGRNQRDSRRYFFRLRAEGPILSGIWRDESGGRYHFGAVQFVRDPNGLVLVGKFVGRDRDNRVNWGPWVLGRTQESLEECVRQWRSLYHHPA